MGDFVKHRVNRRIAADNDPIVDNTGFRFAPEIAVYGMTAGTRSIERPYFRSNSSPELAARSNASSMLLRRQLLQDDANHIVDDSLPD